MYNWNTDINQLKKDIDKYNVWRLEQLINFGLNGEKICITQLKRYWPSLHIDPKRKRVLEFWLK
ncbi:TPA: hypothetical protein DCY43_03575 [candidate division WWE3 bacterium]|uniref:Uncharacterized protein n=2 Tax=Katanobacteria TaxID=422282 RepID=A0A1F4V3L5_UNCKA|nr:MAG: hypothetical protein A2709_02980 [candidate division WWE3 bacterium RIFCSPHIGHO2_01_FULL_43_9]HAZ29792.1 hypothetical protein [candidate division WWE3 bacterium]